MPYTTITFYKYAHLTNLETLKEELTLLCKELKILGRILIGEEGINAGMCGTTETINHFKQELLEKKEFSNLTFREQETATNTYHKLVIRVRKEIVAFGTPVNPTITGEAISPHELDTLFEQKEIVLVDARNDYETNVGTFQNAITLPIKTFREFPNASTHLEPYKQKKIILFCTGGIRCEKASAYLKQQGYPSVYQLQGGIINYLQQSGKHFTGSCFVFDDRLITSTSHPITHCTLCSTLTDTYTNCFNMDCDKLFLSCSGCKQLMNNTCCDQCKTAPRQRRIKKEEKILGKIINYYPKAHAAYVTLVQPLKKNITCMIKGTTTNYTETLTELRNEDGYSIDEALPGSMITIKVSTIVRKNDLLLA